MKDKITRSNSALIKIINIIVSICLIPASLAVGFWALFWWYKGSDIDGSHMPTWLGNFIMEPADKFYTSLGLSGWKAIVGALLLVAIGILLVILFYVIVPIFAGYFFLDVSVYVFGNLRANFLNLIHGTCIKYESITLGKLIDAHEAKKKAEQDAYYDQFRHGHYYGDFDEEQSSSSSNDGPTYSDAPVTMTDALRAFGFSNTNYTKEQLDRKRRELMKKFHPDANPGIDTAAATRSVEASYRFLLEQLQK